MPPQLFEAVSAPGGGRLTLVLGAGCSKATPTNLPLGSEVAREAHRRLVEDGVLDASECTDPSDLSLLAQVVFQKLGGQIELVKRLPLADFRGAQPNDGYLCAVALLLEGIVKDVIYLNFDLAFSHSIALLGGGRQINTAVRKRSLSGLGQSNLIHLHGDANNEPEDWVLRLKQLDEDWRDDWEQYVVTRVMTSPVVVFAGLGSPAAVLTTTLAKIKAAMTGSVAIMAAPGTHEESRFAASCGVEAAEYVKLAWNEFMELVGKRVVAEQRAMVSRSYEQLVEDQHLFREAPEEILDLLSEMSLVELGCIRGKWLLSNSKYEPLTNPTRSFVADIVLILAAAIRIAAATSSSFQHDGNLELRNSDGRIVATMVPVSGRGTLRWSQLEGKLLERGWKRRTNFEKWVVLGCNVVGRRDLAPPIELVPRRDDCSILEVRQTADAMLDLDDLTTNPSLLTSVWE